MRERKRFFNIHNKLNKGYEVTQDSQEIDNITYRKHLANILPPLELVEQYEEIYPGIVNQLIAMTKKEQMHRHEMHVAQVKNQSLIKVIGQIFAIITIVSICCTIFALIVAENYPMAITIIGLSISAVLLIAFLARQNIIQSTTKMHHKHKKNK